LGGVMPSSYQNCWPLQCPVCGSWSAGRWHVSIRCTPAILAALQVSTGWSLGTAARSAFLSSISAATRSDLAESSWSSKYSTSTCFSLMRSRSNCTLTSPHSGRSLLAMEHLHRASGGQRPRQRLDVWDGAVEGVARLVLGFLDQDPDGGDF